MARRSRRRQTLTAVAAMLLAATSTTLSVVVPAPPALATGSEADWTVSGSLIGHLIDENGNDTTVPVEVSPPIPVVEGGKVLWAQTYSARILPELFAIQEATPTAPQTNLLSECKDDNGALAKMCITMFYEEYATTANVSNIRVEKYIAGFWRNDNQVSLDIAFVQTSVAARTDTGRTTDCGNTTYYVHEIPWWGAPDQGVPYTVRPSYYRCYFQILPYGQVNYLVGQPNMLFSRGSRSWKFYFNLVKGNLQGG